jgi:nucleotide-binding universal stress UspA family protein
MPLPELNRRMNTPNPSKQANQISSPLEEVKFKRVLVPVNFRAGTFETLRYAKTLADKFGAVVEVLHVLQFSPGRNEASMPPGGLICAMSGVARQELKKLAGILWESEMDAMVQIREGRVHEAILHEARAINAELIIMATREHRWPMGMLRRNIVKWVIQNSPCPVMVLRAGGTGIGANRQNKPAFAARGNFHRPAGR